MMAKDFSFARGMWFWYRFVIALWPFWMYSGRPPVTQVTREYRRTYHVRARYTQLSVVAAVCSLCVAAFDA